MESCSCPECVSACRTDPGRLLPEDVGKLAGLLGIPEAELLAQYLVKILLSPKDTVYGLAPAKRKGKRFIAQPGTVAPDYYARERGVCVFLDEQGACAATFTGTNSPAATQTARAFRNRMPMQFTRAA